MAMLPKDLVIEVLSILPVKSLLRFKCVSKLWCAIIESRCFRYNHLKNNESRRGCLWAQYYGLRTSFLDEDFFLNVFFPDETLVDSTYLPFDVPVFRGILRSLCNGIFLISDKEQSVYALWNPATKECRHLPHPGLPLRWSCRQQSCGFGLDPRTNDYKVIILQWHSEFDYILGRVLTLGTQYWKNLGTDLETRSIVLNRTTCHTYLNGFFYFLGSHSQVISFDMHTDALQVIPPPNELPLPPIGQWVDPNECLAVYQDRIALFKIRPENQCLNIWLLREGSWTKHLSVGPLWLWNNEWRSLESVGYPVGCWNNEWVLLHSETYELLLCNLTTLEIRNLGLRGTYDCLGMNNYKESLISIEDEYRYRREREHLV